MSLFKLKEVAELQPLVGEVFHTGSRVICNPPPQDTDDDYIVLVGEGAFDYVQETLLQNDWKVGGSFQPQGKNRFKDDTFISYKKDEYNIILTASRDYFESFKRATYLASHLNLLEKEDRVTLFEAIVRDNYPKELKLNYKTRKGWKEIFQINQAEPPVVAPRILNDAGRIELPQLVGNPVLEARDAAIAQWVIDNAELQVRPPMGLQNPGNPDRELELRMPDREELAALDAERHAEFERDLREQEADALRDALRELAAEELEQERELD